MVERNFYRDVWNPREAYEWLAAHEFRRSCIFQSGDRSRRRGLAKIARHTIETMISVCTQLDGDELSTRCAT